MRIADAEILTAGDRMLVLVLLEDGSLWSLLDVPAGRVHLERRDLVGRKFGAARNQALCWLEAADDGIHRIVLAEVRKIAEDDPERWDVHGNAEVVALLSDGSVATVFAFYDDELSFDPDELRGLSPRQAVILKGQRDIEYLSNAYHRADLRQVYCCLTCSTYHR